MSENKKLKVAFLWHMHQPYYFNSETDRFEMPWVRFHALKDYLDMPLMAAEKAGLRITFNLVPSLLDQLDLYCQGKVDRHLELSRIPARELTFEQKREIIATFFSAHFPRMIEPYTRYRQLYRKKESCGEDLNLAVEIFSSAEWRDLQVWSNLAWVDPMFRQQPPIKGIFEKGRDYTEDDKNALLEFEIDLLKKIVPTYKRLQDEGRIEVSFTPYYHPILPLLIDTDAAREALPDIALPRQRFAFPEDARWHVDAAIKKYQEIFGRSPAGMWPSEGSLSESTVRLLAEAGIKWAASDQDLLASSARKSGLDPRQFAPHTIYALEGVPGLKLLFRDKGLSDRIGFVYSGWDPTRAANDFIEALNNIRTLLKNNLDNAVVPVILDGENAWEYYPDDGILFLRKLYEALGESETLETVFFSDAADKVPSTVLPRLLAGSWINHNFRIWIGHQEDNAAWDLLSVARKTLAEYQKNNPQADGQRLARAWRHLHAAEGSDWCWWYGDDHISAFNREFDELYRNHLRFVYTTLELPPPPEISRAIHQGRTESFIIKPEALVTPIIDGRLTHYYEWSGAGVYDCSRAGSAMHRAERKLDNIHFAYDYEAVYIRLDFIRGFNLTGLKEAKISLEFVEAANFEIPLGAEGAGQGSGYEYYYRNILETKIMRNALLKSGHGALKMFVKLNSGNKLMEKWPVDDPIVIDIPERARELFWQV